MASNSFPTQALIDPRTRFSDLKLELPPRSFPVLERDFPTKPDHGERSYKGRGRLNGRHALITGGDSGIGRAIVIAMAREGAKVAINYLPEEEPDAKDLYDFLMREHIKIFRFPGNLLDETFCSELVSKAEKAMGGLDILVNNAGYSEILNPDITTYTTEQFDKAFHTNVYAGFWLTRAAVKCMPPGSSIIFTVSDVVANPTGAVHAYSASKGAVASLVQTLGSALASEGIRVNGVAPGFTFTPLLALAGLTTETLNAAGAAIPLGRVAQPVELAPMYVNFADATATYTSGAIVSTNGGATGYTTT